MGLEPIPTVDFDPNVHLISCRENKEGRQVFVTLQSLSQAEEVYEAAARPAVANDPRLSDIERQLADLRASIPPSQLSEETSQALGELAKAIIVSNQKTDAALERVSKLESTLLQIAERLGV
jgi:crotonobetainyl-CoA:carnitine CoA-transferase CaiB-like acyl-CoA transferase